MGLPEDCILSGRVEHLEASLLSGRVEHLEAKLAENSELTARLEERLVTVFNDLEEIKTCVKTMAKKQEEMVNVKNKWMGVGIAILFVGSVVFSGIDWIVSFVKAGLGSG
jgi:hypothetical protein